MFRIGHGYDVHKFGGDKPLILGGVLFEGEQGLLAHSDGDVVLHAVCDALLGAVAKGDIGHHFPDTSDEFAGADSQDLTKSVMSLVRSEGYQLGNLDVTIVAQKPKMASKIEPMKKVIAAICNSELTQVNLKATTTEKLGFVGREEGIAVHAVCLLQKSQ
ncbi:2-C-methyl-D-erythritol 2,4-cyclodiphosphate synthase [Kangiella sediminilitoris]|uniref:2-C-methyl-D-erythritol 2,4-cyclodiphosphate synthase n=1 Tax=Kangiella sediminilitoris TaxID=1144748 RepID=A0A1B3BBT5_9GAMM|nr:2-C-methyl-D-erythritol 2,4-cyclodiphosphate synthase [Kangiella sediminilitoris]AOE50227.1 2-C-methyl-D-erythritol 2,4-cyclodiphosphate synthase [Kangiella sediminilitoris]